MYILVPVQYCAMHINNQFSAPLGILDVCFRRTEADLSSCISHNQPIGLSPNRSYGLMEGSLFTSTYITGPLDGSLGCKSLVCFVVSDIGFVATGDRFTYW